MSKVLILGKGYIGEQIHEALGWPSATTMIHQFKDIFEVIEKYRPQTIVNCIGFTGQRNVDDCELALDETLEANTFVPILLAEAALRNKIKFVHLSSGCIYHYDYDKQKPISEEDVPDFYDLYYSRSKIYTDNVLVELAKRYNILILRIRVPLAPKPHPRNILNKLLKYKTVIDVPNSVTYIPDFIKNLQHLLKINARGIYNVVCQGGLRYPDILDEYQKYVPEFQYSTIKLKDLKLVRTNLVLSTAKLEKTGAKVRTVHEVIKECVKEYVKFS